MKIQSQKASPLVKLSLTASVFMLVGAGFVIDLMRYETARTTMQYTIDQAVSAAADVQSKSALTPEEVVADHLKKAGMSALPVSVEVDDSYINDELAARVVYAKSPVEKTSFVVSMIAKDTLTAPVRTHAADSAEGALALTLSDRM